GGDATVQQFEGGMLRWLPERGQADVIADDEVGDPPWEAVLLETPAMRDGGMVQPAWSGWWWPATNAIRSPHLFDFDGPLRKYDAYAQWRTGADPATLRWERTRFLLGGPIW